MAISNPNFLLPEHELMQQMLKRHGLDDFGYDVALDRAIQETALIAGFDVEPPTIDEFLDSKDYCKYIGDDMYPFWREQLREIFPTRYWSPYLEVAFTGPIGIGKTTVILAALMYDLCRLLCMRDPHYTFQLMQKAPIVIAFINTTLKLADDILYNQFRDWMIESPFFQKHLIMLSKNRWKLKKNIVFARGSRMGHMLGRNVIMSTLSELNFQGESQKRQAYKNYTAVKRRMEARFGRGGGYISPGRLWLDSSRTDEAGFLEQHLKNLYAHPENSLVVAEAVWVILGDAGKNKYSGETFPVYEGDSANDPQLFDLTKPEDVKTYRQLMRDDRSKIIDVPVEHKPAFEIDLFGSIRDIAGRATWGASKFIAYPWMITKALNLPMQIPEIIRLDFYDKSDTLINRIKDRNGKVFGLRKDHGQKYYVHFDLGVSKDKAGIAFTRNAGMITVRAPGDLGYGVLLKDECKYSTDLTICVAPKPGSEIPITKLKNLVIDLGKAGYTIAGASADGFQSTNLLQDLAALNIPTELISTQKTKDQFGFLKRCMQDERWDAPNHKILEFELLNLIDTGKMIDHPSNNESENKDGSGGIGQTEMVWSKDLADGCAGSVWHCQMKTASKEQSQEAYNNWIQDNAKAQREYSLEDTLYELAKEQKAKQNWRP